MKTINYHPAARKVLRHMPANLATRIRGKILAYATNPASQANNVKTLSDGVHIRLRVGDWRIIMVDGNVLDVLKVGPRGGIYD